MIMIIWREGFGAWELGFGDSRRSRRAAAGRLAWKKRRNRFPLSVNSSPLTNAQRNPAVKLGNEDDDRTSEDID